MKQLLVVAHTPSANTQQLLAAILRGAHCEEFADSVRVVHKPALEAGPDDIRACDAILLFTTENLGYMSGALKDFFDRSYYPVLEALQGRPYATMVCAGSDGHNAARQVACIAMGWRLKPVSEPVIICTHAQTPEAILAPKHLSDDDLQTCRALGESMAAGLLLGVF